MLRVLVLDTSSDYWDVMAEDYNNDNIEITSCNPSDTHTTQRHLEKIEEFDVVILHEGGRRGSVIGGLTRLISDSKIAPPPKPISTIILDNLHIDLAEAKNKCKDLDAWFNVKDISPMPISANIIRAACKQAQPVQIDIDIEYLPFPARILGKNRDFISKNAKWSWASDRPDFCDLEGEEMAFTLPHEKPVSGQEYSSGYWLLREEALPDGRILQIAHQHIPNDRNDMNQNIKFLWQLLSNIGFVRMRYYLLEEAPESLGVLTFHSKYPGAEYEVDSAKEFAEENDAVYWCKKDGNFSAPIDDVIEKNIEKLRSERKKQIDDDANAASLIWDEFPTEEKASLTARFFRKLAGVRRQGKALYIPVFASGSREIIALSVLDLEEGKEPVTKAHLKRREAVVLERLGVLRRQIGNTNHAKTNEEQQEARAFLTKNMPEEHTEKARNKFVETMLNRCLDKSPYQHAMIAWRSHELVSPTILALSHEAEGPYKQEIGEFVNKNDHPALNKALESGMPVFYHEGLTDRHDGKIGKGYPRFALPLKFTNETLGAIVFRTDDYKVRFLKSDISRIQTCMDICGPILYLISASIASEQAKLRLMHDVRSSLSRAMRELKNENGNSKKTSWFLSHLQDSAMQLEAEQNDRLEEFNPVSIINEQVNWANEAAPDFGKKFERKIDDNIANKIIGLKANFEFIVRTLLSNALFHSDKSEVDEEQPVIVNLYAQNGSNIFSVISLANKTTQEEINTAFQYGATNVGTRRGDGSHIALSLSTGFADDFKGDIQLSLDMDSKANQIAVATFNWKSK